MRHRLLTLLLVLGIPLLGVGLAAPAIAQTGPTVDVTSGTLVARGAAVDLAVTASCEPGFTGYLSLIVTQRSGNDIAKGSGGTSVPCTGEPQTVTVRVIAEAGVAPFRVGDAVVTGIFDTWDDYGFQPIGVNETIRIAR